MTVETDDRARGTRLKIRVRATLAATLIATFGVGLAVALGLAPAPRLSTTVVAAPTSSRALQRLGASTAGHMAKSAPSTNRRVLRAQPPARSTPAVTAASLAVTVRPTAPAKPVVPQPPPQNVTSATQGLPASNPPHSAAVPISFPPHSAPVIEQLSSAFWSGFTSHHDRVGAVTGTFTVPSADGACGQSADLAEWVGLGGTTLAQPLGTRFFPFVQNGFSVTADGHATAWYELFDAAGAGPIVAGQTHFSAGDRVTISAVFSADHAVLTFAWNDLTTGKAASAVVTNAARYFPTSGAAEWIAERYPPDGNLVNLPPLLHLTSPITVTGARVGAAGQPPDVTDGLTGTTAAVNMLADALLMSVQRQSDTSFRAEFRSCL